MWEKVKQSFAWLSFPFVKNLPLNGETGGNAFLNSQAKQSKTVV